MTEAYKRAIVKLYAIYVEYFSSDPQGAGEAWVQIVESVIALTRRNPNWTEDQIVREMIIVEGLEELSTTFGLED